MDLGSREAEGAAADRSVQFAVFSFLFGTGLSAHELIVGDGNLFSPQAPVTLAAMWLLLRPTSLIRFATVAVTQCVCVAMEMPIVVNHWLALGAMTLAILIAAATLLVANGGRRLDAGVLYDHIAPPLRIIVLLVYLFAGIAKVNPAFLDVELSAAGALYREVTHYLPFFPSGPGMTLFAAWMTIAIEFGLPLMLLIPRLRVPGIVCAMGFHLAISLSGLHIAFASLAIAFMALFLPDDIPQRLRRVRLSYPFADSAAQILHRFAMSRWTFPAIAGFWIVLASIRTFEYLPYDVGFFIHQTVNRLTRLSYFPYLGVLMVLLYLCLKQGLPWRYRKPFFAPAQASYLVVPALMVLNGLCPYLGLKTESSFTMFSNLQTEGDQWNHIFMPRSMRVFDFQNNLVEIVESNDPLLQIAAETGSRWVHFELRRYLREHPELSVTYRHGGEEVRIEPYGDRTMAAAGPDNLLLRKLLWFRDVPLPENNTIRH